MLWRGGRQSDNVEDRRGEGGGFSYGGGGQRFPVGMRTGKIGGLGLVLLVILGLVFGVDPSALLQGVPSGGGGPSQQYMPSPQTSSAPGGESESELKQFVSVVLAETEDTWKSIFQAHGWTYEEPRMVLFSGMVNSACGMAQSASGPFYCPLDHKLYLDFSFFNELDQRFGAPGDFAQAYVIAHEIGHHVQNQLGILPKVEEMKGQVSRSDANQLSVMVELQADCFAGVWANRAQQQRKILEPGDLEEGIRAAGAVGDDRIQRQTQGYVVPDAFTHGSAEQRARWFRRGLESGDIAACDTFNAGSR
ncbi:MAG: neutral zinc metallopeptidase [Rhodospirillales bacterium]